MKDLDAIVRRTKYEGYLNSQTWKNIRYAKLVSVDFKCEACNYGEYEFQEGPIDVHHKTYERLGDERMSDLEVLCRPCHEKRHGRKFPKGDRT